jgi:hypothetical protein
VLGQLVETRDRHPTAVVVLDLRPSSAAALDET